MTDSIFDLIAAISLGTIIGFLGCFVIVKFRSRSAAAPKNQVEFRFKNKELIGACSRAKRSLSLEDLDEDIYHQLMDRLSAIFPDLEHRLDDSLRRDSMFTLTEPTQNGLATLQVTSNGAHLNLRLSGIEAPLSRKTMIDSDQARAMTEELTLLRATVETAPYLSWREASDGTVEWANAAYSALVAEADLPQDSATWPPPQLFHGGQVTPVGTAPKTKRVSLAMRSGAQRSFEIMRYGRNSGTLNFAIDVGATVGAEESLRSFVQTLTQTFAALPIGLAIFDRSRTLVMFNPALMDLTNLDPAWLTARPTLYDFLNQLREKRMLPERRDFSDWRKKMTELEESAADGTYCETWALPTGQTYRVTGRPHPEGAVAFLFEDITAEMSLTRKFRRELSMNQMFLDNLPEALAAFGDDGVITMVNSAYDELWGTDPENALDQLTITDATRLWQANSAPSPIWGDAREFIVQRGERSEWSDTATLTDGRVINCRFQPLTGGATLVSFSNVYQRELSPAPPKPAVALSS